MLVCKLFRRKLLANPFLFFVVKAAVSSETITENNPTKKAPVIEKCGQVAFLVNFKVLEGIDIRFNDQLERFN